jgi:ribosomal-protein-alanine N-acetyltransferase
MEIRRSLPKDVSEIALMEREAFEDAWSDSDILSAICTEGSMCYSALNEKGVIAYIIGRKISPEGEIYRIATKAEYRRRGIAYRLLDYAVKCERGVGVENIFLEVREKNIPARKLYTAYGFKEIGVRKRYYKDPEDDAIVMLRAHSADMQF